MWSCALYHSRYVGRGTIESNSIVANSIARIWISSCTWWASISCIRLNSGTAAFVKSVAIVAAATRSSGTPGGGTGHSASQYGNDRRAGSAASRLWRCVVPVRGWPTMIIGFSISMSWIDGSRFNRSCRYRRFFARETSSVCTLT